MLLKQQSVIRLFSVQYVATLLYYSHYKYGLYSSVSVPGSKQGRQAVYERDTDAATANKIQNYLRLVRFVSVLITTNTTDDTELMVDRSQSA